MAPVRRMLTSVNAVERVIGFLRGLLEGWWKRIKESDDKEPLLFDIEMDFLTRHDEETEQWVAFSPTLDLHSQGDTEEEALENIHEAVNLFLDDCHEQGTLDGLLKELVKKPECTVTFSVAVSIRARLPDSYQTEELPPAGIDTLPNPPDPLLN